MVCEARVKTAFSSPEELVVSDNQNAWGFLRQPAWQLLRRPRSPLTRLSSGSSAGRVRTIAVRAAILADKQRLFMAVLDWFRTIDAIVNCADRQPLSIEVALGELLV